MFSKTKHSINYNKIFFIFSIIFSIITTYFITLTCIDADASSELVLAEHLAKNLAVLSEDWIYSTEIRFINTQLVYAPLFLIFDTFHLVRFFGSVILQGILIISFYFFTRLLNMDKKYFYLCAGLLLLPISVCYGRIILYNCYYIPHISISLLVVGLTFAKDTAKKSRIAQIFLLMVLSILGGLGGIRQLLMTHAPVLLTIFIYYFVDDFLCKDSDSSSEKKRLKLLLIAVSSAVFSIIGFLINKVYLMEKYTFADYSENTINLLNPDNINNVLYGFFHHFGFRDEIPLLSVLGVLSVLGIFLGMACLIASFFGILKYKSNKNIQETVPLIFFISYTVVMAFVFLVIGNGYYFVLYFTPLTIWMIPVFVLQINNIPKGISVFNLKKLLPYTAIFIILLNGIFNSIYFLNDNYFQQKYEGLGYQEKNQKENLSAVVSFLEKENYELGYATFWNGNIITEMTDGDVKIINLSVNEYSGKTEYNNWLTLKSNRNLQNQKSFILLENNLQTVFENKNDLTNCEIVYKDDKFIVYNLEK